MWFIKTKSWWTSLLLDSEVWQKKKIVELLAESAILFVFSGIWANWQEGASSTSRAYRIHHCSLLNRVFDIPIGKHIKLNKTYSSLQYYTLHIVKLLVHMLCDLDLKFCQFYMEQKSVESNRAALALHIRVNRC